MRVRQFELRLLAVALTVLWAAGGGIVLIAYRPGGPLDLMVGVAASLPLVVSVAPIVWPPLVRSDRGSAGVFWLGLSAALLLLPSIAGVAGQVIAGGTQPLMPSLEVIYPWALALVATSLFAGLGISRQVINEIGLGRRQSPCRLRSPSSQLPSSAACSPASRLPTKRRCAIVRPPTRGSGRLRPI